MTVSDLTVQVLKIDGIAEGLSIAFSSRETSIRLAGLRNKTGRIFTGITDQGNQGFALIRSRYANTAPWLRSILETCAK